MTDQIDLSLDAAADPKAGLVRVGRVEIEGSRDADGVGGGGGGGTGCGGGEVSGGGECVVVYVLGGVPALEPGPGAAGVHALVGLLATEGEGEHGEGFVPLMGDLGLGL